MMAWRKAVALPRVLCQQTTRPTRYAMHVGLLVYVLP